MPRVLLIVSLSLLLLASVTPPITAEDAPTLPYAIVDTGQDRCWDARSEILYPAKGMAFFGQDAQYVGNTARYEKTDAGTVTDLVTGLTWQRDPGTEKKTWSQAVAGAAKCRVGGHKDWRLPTIKELYSLIFFSGRDLDPQSSGTSDQRPFIDTDAFSFSYGDLEKGERLIDSQWATSTKYVDKTMGGMETMFGVNFADGRIKGYGTTRPGGRGEKTFFVIYVRGNPDYGKNEFKDNEDGTITDRATGLVWMKEDSGHLKAGPGKDGRLNWEQALAFAEGLTYAGKSDWRLPNAKELQSIVDYSRSPGSTGSAAIDPLFLVSGIKGADGKKDYPFYWTGTTHASARGGSAAVYFAFGRAGGWMRDRRTGEATLMDVHGAGSQRSDPKAGNPDGYPRGRGPQGDVVRILNHVRCVRGGKAMPRSEGPEPEKVSAPEARGPEGEGPPRGGGDRFVKRLDRDGDGKVSRKEFDGPAEHFKEFDRDGDGFISADEAPTGPPPGRRGPPRRDGGR